MSRLDDEKFSCESVNRSTSKLCRSSKLNCRNDNQIQSAFLCIPCIKGLHARWSWTSEWLACTPLRIKNALNTTPKDRYFVALVPQDIIEVLFLDFFQTLILFLISFFYYCLVSWFSELMQSTVSALARSGFWIRSTGKKSMLTQRKCRHRQHVELRIEPKPWRCEAATLFAAPMLCRFSELICVNVSETGCFCKLKFAAWFQYLLVSITLTKLYQIDSRFLIYVESSVWLIKCKVTGLMVS